MSNFKLLVMDVDDTLTHDARVISQANLDAVARAQQAGLFVTIATGRGFKASELAWKPMGIQGPVINYGGALINDTRTNACIYASEFPSRLVHALLEYAAELGIYAHLCDGDIIIHESEHPFADIYARELGIPQVIDPDIRNKDWVNIPKALYYVEPERIDEYLPMVAKRFEGAFKVSGSKPGFIEINMLGADKGAAVARVAQSLGIEKQQVAAIGDNTFDIEMLQWAGYSAAVGNAQQPVKEIVNIVVPSCAENGVAWFIDNVVLKGG